MIMMRKKIRKRLILNENNLLRSWDKEFGFLLNNFLFFTKDQDFVKMIEVQSAEIDPDDLRPDKNRWKHPDA